MARINRYYVINYTKLCNMYPCILNFRIHAFISDKYMILKNPHDGYKIGPV